LTLSTATNPEKENSATPKKRKSKESAEQEGWKAKKSRGSEKKKTEKSEVTRVLALSSVDKDQRSAIYLISTIYTTTTLIPRTLDISSALKECEILTQDEFKSEDVTEGATHVVLGAKKITLKVLYGIAKGVETSKGHNGVGKKARGGRG
jgi:hypothetical protein